MKRAAIMIAVLGAVLGMCAWSFGQSTDKTAAQNPPAGQAAQPARPAGQAAAPAGKRPPKANSQEEFAAYKTAAALTDAPALEKASDDFAVKYPDSELRPLLYRSAMQRYQLANNADKMLEMGKKVLAIDPDDPEALVGVAQVMAERTRDTDLDRDQRLAEARKDAERALNATLARPENATVQIVTRQHFGPGDLSIAAQLAAIKAANPDGLIAWSAGTPAAS